MNRALLIIAFVLVFGALRAQDLDVDAEPGNYDNLLYFGNKVTWGSTNWINSGELQVRLKEEGRQLFQWQLEYVGTYLVNKNLEIVPDLRFTIKPDRYEFRPGFGIVLKTHTNKGQFVHQFKGQIDFKSNDNATTQTIRYFPSYNHLIAEDWLVSVLAGTYYKFTPEKNDIDLLITGIGAAYIINKQHTVNFTYAFGGQKSFTTGDWMRFSAFMFRLIINVNKEYDYQPARYINF